ncbi:SH3 domain-containing kinase-binding 1-like [Solea senegalensis]|uniref:SH3 domain-containing kinase-binding 1-like n=2 Tax=Solea senegalensis TaxID=28829 RepID=A0AAV6T3G7_SOLSE|nr:SH3 domain-containing protein 21 [Solea senegalensis]KAG7523880.1 SH3 domain-containing kinase-binding 1-like [Solea senegalensis]
MQHIYMHSHEHFEVFTTVLAPQGRYRHRAEAEQMVVVHSYRPHWPDELQLRPGDVILVLSKHEEERWFGRRQDGQQGYFPASCVMELSQMHRPPKDLHRTLSLRSSAWDGNSGVRRRQTNGHILQGLRRGSRGGVAGATGGVGGGLALDEGRGESKNPFLAHRPQIPLPQPVASQPQSHRSPGLLHRILSKCRKKTECQGATNGAFEGD